MRDRATLFAVTAPGLEEALMDELGELVGGKCRSETGGVTFEGGLAELYRVHVQARLPVRCWVRMGSFRGGTLEALAAGVRKLDWATVLHARQPVDVKVSSTGSRIRMGIERKVEAAIRDGNRQPRRDPGRPSRIPARVLVRIVKDEVEVSVDASGEPLYRRGWRKDVSDAPLRENLAAAVLHLAEWQPDEPLVDPMCGSGTIAIEAATIALAKPPGQARSFAFEAWPCHDAALWRRMQREVPEQPLDPAPILAADRDPHATAAARANVRRAQVERLVTVRDSSIERLEWPAKAGLVVANPPYGARIKGARQAWEALGEALRERAGWRVALLVPDPMLLRATGLPLHRVARFDNGGIPVTLHMGTIRPAARRGDPSDDAGH